MPDERFMKHHYGASGYVDRRTEIRDRLQALATMSLTFSENFDFAAIGKEAMALWTELDALNADSHPAEPSAANRSTNAELLEIIEGILPFAEFGWVASHPEIEKVAWAEPPDLDAGNKSLDRARNVLGIEEEQPK